MRSLRPVGPAVPLLVATGLLGAAPARAETYEVGEAMPYAAIGDVPWESLMPGDVVRIHHRATPYREKWVIGRRGTEEAPIVIQGVPGPGGELPVIDGRDATTRPTLRFTNEDRGVIKIGGSSTPEDTLPAWIVIEGLEIRSARPPHGYVRPDGGPGSYASNAASIYVEKAEHLVIRGCVLHDSGNGLFIGSFGGMTRDILVEGNHLHDNGIEGSAFQHNSYTQALGIVFQHNHYGPLRAGCEGNNLKDRSAGLVVRTNWIESGNRQLDLVDGGPSEVSHPSYGATYVYGNVLIEREGEGNSQIVHYGGDGDATANYRKGILHFFHNTVISTRDGNTTLLRLSTNDERADVRNNVLYVTASGDRLAMLAGSGRLTLSHNWMRPGRADAHGPLDGTVEDDGTTITGASPGFADEPAGDYHLGAGSGCVDAATVTGLGPEHAVRMQYVRHQDAEARPTNGAPDIGAYELCLPGACGATEPDAGPGTRDGGAPPSDAGAPRDAGPDGGGGGCTVVRARWRGPAVAGLLLTALLLAARRRRPSARLRER